MVDRSLVCFVVGWPIAHRVGIDVVSLHVVPVKHSSLGRVRVDSAVIVNTLATIVTTKLSVWKLTCRPLSINKLLGYTIPFGRLLRSAELQFVGLLGMIDRHHLYWLRRRLRFGWFPLIIRFGTWNLIR